MLTHHHRQEKQVIASAENKVPNKKGRLAPSF